MISMLRVLSLGLAGLAVVLWALGRHRAKPPLDLPAEGAAAGPRPDPACLCDQCDQAPACDLTYPDCVQGQALARPGGRSGRGLGA